MTVAITEYRNAKAIKADNTSFDVEINHPQWGWIPYTLHPEDTDNTINNDDLKTLIGSDYAAYTAPTDAEKAALIRMLRETKLIDEVDPIVSNPLLWSDLGTSKQNEWTAYRTALLDITTQGTFPNSVSWPTKPS
tara:strand:+ start:250 stop:654 length:405 start_codon:yes stop_codon:yes gene_type:complete